MIRITVWSENVQDRMKELPGYDEVIKVHPNGIHNTLADFLKLDEEFTVRTAVLGDPECGLTEDILNDTDVLLWWAHVAHDKLPDEIAKRVHDHVLKGMGFMPLHSAHLCKPMTSLLGTSCTLKWRDGDVCRLWCTAPGHPIAAGVPDYIEIDEEEMYGEFFDIPNPETQVFISWFSGGEVFRSGNCWTRGLGRIFYFQPGHETNYAYHNEHIRRIIKNAVRWCAPTARREVIDCPHVTNTPEMKRIVRMGK